MISEDLCSKSSFPTAIASSPPSLNSRIALVELLNHIAANSADLDTKLSRSYIPTTAVYVLVTEELSDT